MPFKTGIVKALKAWDLEVFEVDDWPTRGNPSFNPGGVVCHHTAGAATGDMPSLGILINGRPDLPGPLCNVGLSRSGVCYVVAAGRANHAGPGSWRGFKGNSSMFGIEAENNGRQEWPSKQLHAYYRCSAALESLTYPKTNSDSCGHKEWTSRKPDPHTLGMGDFRMRVNQLLPGLAPTPPPQEEIMRGVVNHGFIESIGKNHVVRVEPPGVRGSSWFNLTCRPFEDEVRGWACFLTGKQLPLYLYPFVFPADASQGVIQWGVGPSTPEAAEIESFLVYKESGSAPVGIVQYWVEG